MAGDMTPGRARITAEKRARIVELRDEGWGFREIADELGFDVANIWRHYQAAMRQIPAAAIEEHAKRCALRLDEQLRRVDMERDVVMDILTKRHVHISNGHVVREIIGRDEETGRPIYGDAYEDDAPTMAAIDRLVKLDDQEARLLGMYPKQTISVERPTTELDAARIALIEQAKARVAERRAAEKEGRAP